MKKRGAGTKRRNKGAERTLNRLSEYAKRGNTERRGWRPLPMLPFFDSSGILVTKDRRKILDRRINDLGLESE